MDNKKIAVVTGGSRGIGKEIAVKLAEEAYVIVNYQWLRGKGRTGGKGDKGQRWKC